MAYPILKELRALDVNNISAVLAFLRRAKLTYNDITLEAMRSNPSQLSDSDGVSSIYTANFDYLQESGDLITKCDFDTIARIHSTLERESQKEELSLTTGEVGATLTTIEAIFTLYGRDNHPHIIAALDEILDALNAFPNSFTLEKNAIEKLKERFISSENIKDIEIKDTLQRFNVNSIEELYIRVDHWISEKLPTAKSANNKAIELNALRKASSSSSTQQLDTLAQLADQLVQDAERRANTFPEERIIAARIRLTINTQRKSPVAKEAFLKKLRPQLETARAHFSRHRTSFAIRVLQKIAAVIVIIATGITPGLAVKCAYSYKTTGKIRLFSNATKAKDTVDKLGEQAKSPQTNIAAIPAPLGSVN